MTRAKTILALFVLVTAFVAPQSAGQEPQDDVTQHLDFRVDFPDGVQASLPFVPGQAEIRLRITDQSRDGVPPPQLSLGGGVAVQQHQYRLEYEPLVDPEGWAVQFDPPSTILSSGQTADIMVRFLTSKSPAAPELPIRINITMTPDQCCGSLSQSVVISGATEGITQLGARAVGEGPTIKVRPDQTAEFQLEVFNLASQGKAISFRTASNQCGLSASFGTGYVEGLTKAVYPVLVKAPADKLYYALDSCPINIEVQAADGSASKMVPLTVQVQGVFIDPGSVINLAIFLAIVGAIVWLILAAKRRTEEEILGKPQPPWTLPAEQLYLAELGKKDPQAAYVVRHFLMEDEYTTSLLWYKSYKRATRGRRAVERKVLRLEHKFEQWDLKQQEKLASGDDHMERDIDRLQGKLDKKANKAHKKELKKWKKAVGKLEAKAAGDHNKAMGAWKSEAKKAKKKGQPEPKKPAMPQLDIPSEPKLRRILLDDHKWAAKKEHILARGDKEDDKAEARYQAARKKKLDKLEIKLHRMAEKIDDPEFVAEHPMLTAS